jgi:hypothetical protein
LEQEAAVLARLAVIYIDSAGNEKSKAFGAYLPRPNFVNYSLSGEGIPDGSMVCFLRALLCFMTDSDICVGSDQVRFYADVSAAGGAC